jgi:hypothetical protein
MQLPISYIVHCCVPCHVMLIGMHVFAKGFSEFCWTVTIGVSPAANVSVGSKVNVTVTDITYDCVACGAPFCSGGVSSYTLTEDNVRVGMGLQGPAWDVEVSAPPGQRQASFVKQSFEARTVSGQAWALIEVGSDEAPVIVSVDAVFEGFQTTVFEPNTVTITGVAAPQPSSLDFPPVSQLLLLPSKAYRKTHDSITLTAKALDSAGTPVVNASVSFATFGDCKPVLDTVVRNTNAAGTAGVTLKSHQPGAVAVVAAAANEQGVAVLSQPAHVIFYEEHHYVEEREPKYYGSHRHSGGNGYPDVAPHER